jgi:CcmD family protein
MDGSMKFLGSLFAGYAVIWVGLFLYLLGLTRRTRRVEDELESLRALRGR